jgi:DNA mismatch repair protein MutS2
MDTQEEKFQLEEKINQAYIDLDFDLVLKKIIKNLQIEGNEVNFIENLYFSDQTKIENSLEQVDSARKFIVKNQQVSLFNARDLTDTFSRLLKGFVLEGEELAQVSQNMKSFNSIKRQYRQIRDYDAIGSMSELFNTIDDFQNYSFYIDKHFDLNGNARSESSPKLEQIRFQINQLEFAIRSKIEELSKKYSTFLSSEAYTIKNSNYVLPVKINYKSKVKGYIHDYSASGKTIFVEPSDVIKLKNDLNSLISDERKEIERICKLVTNYIHNKANELILSMENTKTIDIIFAKGQFAFDQDCVKQEISSAINLRGVRHPLIEKSIVNDLLFEDKKTMVISGSNTGGKTVNLKIIGIFALLTKIGMTLPAQQAKIPIFKNIYTIMGDGQKITANLSTFASHVLKIKEIVLNVKPDDLVLLDELGTSTDPIEGAALAVSVLKNIHQVGATALLTTHYPEVKNYALTNEDVVAVAVQFDLDKIEPTYKIVYNQTANSNALLIAHKYGLPQNVLADAQEILQENDDFVNNSKLTKLMQEFEEGVRENERLSKQAKLTIDQEKGKITMLEQKYQKRLEEGIQAVKNSYKDQIGKLEETLKSMNTFQKHQEIEAKTLLNKLQKEEEQIQFAAENNELSYQIGDFVLMRDKQIKGYIAAINGKKIVVQKGGMKLNTVISKIELVQGVTQKVKKAHSPRQANTQSVKRPSVYNYEINLVGLRHTQASEKLIKEIDNAILSSAHKIKVIHGFGTGVLKQLAQSQMHKNKNLENVRSGDQFEGGLAVTVADVKIKK